MHFCYGFISSLKKKEMKSNYQNAGEMFKPEFITKNNIMKKIIQLALATALFHTSGYSQQPRLAFTGGATFSKYKVKLDNLTASSDRKAGFTLGLLVDAPIGKNFFLQPGINWTQKGSSNKESSGNITSKETITSNEIEVPVNLLYKFKRFFIGSGFSLSSAMEGQAKYKINGETKKEDIDFGNNESDDIRQFDLGVNILVGYELPAGLFISINFTQGLRDLQPGDSNESKVKCNYFGIRVGYLIKGKK